MLSGQGSAYSCTCLSGEGLPLPCLGDPQEGHLVDCPACPWHEAEQGQQDLLLEEEAEVLVSLFLPEKASYKVDLLSSRLSLSISCSNTSLILRMEV